MDKIIIDKVMKINVIGVLALAGYLLNKKIEKVT